MILLSSIKPNYNNPRTITESKLEWLKGSIKSFEKMMSLNQIIVDENWVILAGQQRHRALVELGYKEIPDDWVLIADNLTEDEKKDLTLIDNAHHGLWDRGVLKSPEWLKMKKLPSWLNNNRLLDISDKAKKKSKPSYLRIGKHKIPMSPEEDKGLTKVYEEFINDSNKEEFVTHLINACK